MHRLPKVWVTRLPLIESPRRDSQLPRDFLMGETILGKLDSEIHFVLRFALWAALSANVLPCSQEMTIRCVYPAVAANRNCATEEKAAADKRLWLNKRDTTAATAICRGEFLKQQRRTATPECLRSVTT